MEFSWITPSHRFTQEDLTQWSHRDSSNALGEYISKAWEYKPCFNHTRQFAGASYFSALWRNTHTAVLRTQLKGVRGNLVNRVSRSGQQLIRRDLTKISISVYFRFKQKKKCSDVWSLTRGNTGRQRFYGCINSKRSLKL